ncbi:valyl-tRNA synthetase, partial [mine drainage metagenome]
KDFIGKTLTLPLTGRPIPIIADSYVDRDFGTGCVKITPAHDRNDEAIGKRHGLPKISVLTLDARIVSPQDVPADDPETEPVRAGTSQSELERVTNRLLMTSAIGQIPRAYWGLDRYEARKAILADLDAQGLLVATKPHKLQVPISQRSDAVIEQMDTNHGLST